MENLNQKTRALGRVILVGAALLFLAVILVDVFEFGGLIRERTPKYERVYLLRMLLNGLASLLLVMGIVKMRPRTADESVSPALSWSTTDWGVVTLSKEEPEKKVIYSLTAKELVLWGFIFISLIFLAMFLFMPRRFYRLCREDRSVEMFTAVLCFISWGIFLGVFVLLRRARKKGFVARFCLFVSLFLAFAIFMFGGEEISWFQRVFDIETPKAFEGNVQREMTLHNFASYHVELVCFFACFVLFVLLPFVHDKTMLFDRYGSLSLFIPDRFFVFFIAFAMAFNTYLWNPLTIQWAFFITLFICNRSRS